MSPMLAAVLITLVGAWTFGLVVGCCFDPEMRAQAGAMALGVALTFLYLPVLAVTLALHYLGIRRLRSRPWHSYADAVSRLPRASVVTPLVITHRRRLLYVRITSEPNTDIPPERLP